MLPSASSSLRILEPSQALLSLSKVATSISTVCALLLDEELATRSGTYNYKRGNHSPVSERRGSDKRLFDQLH